MALEAVPLRQVDMNVVFSFTYGGVLSPESTQMRLYNDTGRVRTITKVRASVGTPSSGSSIVATVLKNGVNIFTGSSTGIALAPGEYTKTGVPTDKIWEDGDYLTVSIPATGSSFPGEDLTINVTVSE